jgi:nucleoside-diphosphate-sugar epimerase
MSSRRTSVSSSAVSDTRPTAPAGLRVVVTGGSGFIGSAVVREALARGHAVTSLIRRCETVAEVAGLETEFADWNDSQALTELLQSLAPDVIVHCAGCSARGAESTEAIYEANVATVWKLLGAVARACPQAGVVLLSSAAVYGPAPEVPVLETAPTVPHTHYAGSKILAEELAKTFARVEGVRAVVARPFNVLGPGEPTGSVVGTILQQLTVQRGIAKVHLREATSVRDFIDVSDVAGALLHLGVHGESGVIYNICSGRGTSVRELANRAAVLSSCTLDLAVDVEHPPRSVSIGAPGLIGGLGWKPVISLDESLARIIAENPKQP